MKIRKDDTVSILLGKDNGRTGKVLRVWSKEGKALVEGINVYKRHLRRRGQNAGGIVDINKPVNISNLMLICPSCKKPTRVGFKIEGDIKMRFCKACGEVVKIGDKK